ncbi:MAG: hypothetical protein K8H74_17230 [Notoacmeibacter sp.]|nr:hypothetical protein [Notoacmeibacter sp.]
MQRLSMMVFAGICSALVGVSGCATSGAGAQSGANSIGPLALGETGTSRGAEALTASLRGGLLSDIPEVALSGDDTRLALGAEYRALEYKKAGETVTWEGTDGKERGEVSSGQPYRVGTQDCRQYSHTVFVNGQPYTARGAACRNEDGSWARLT